MSHSGGFGGHGGGFSHGVGHTHQPTHHGQAHQQHHHVRQNPDQTYWGVDVQGRQTRRAWFARLRSLFRRKTS